MALHRLYSDLYRPYGEEHELQLTLPAPGGPGAGPGRTVRLFFLRDPGPDFSERDRALLVLLRPHLQQAYLDAESACLLARFVACGAGLAPEPDLRPGHGVDR